MIVTCERCATQFQLDDTRVPDSGVRVRCSRCKHAFEIHKSKPAAPAAASDDEESDWQFNEDPPRGGARGSAASVVDDLLGAGGAGPAGKAGKDGESLFEDTSSSGLELGDPGGGGATPATPPATPSAAPPRDASPIAMPEAGASGLDLEGDPPPRKPPAAAADRRAEKDDEAPALDLAGELADELGVGTAEGDLSFDVPLVVSEPDAPEPGSDELSSEDWDVLADGASELGSRTPDVDPDELVDDRPIWRAAIERAAQGVQGAGWVVVALLFALGLYGGLLPAPPVAAAPPATSEAGGVELRDVSGHFVDHVEAGTVYVVTGRLTNTGSRPISAGTLAVEVLDPSGKRLAPPAPAAAPLSAEAIREGRLSGPWRRSPPLRPGESRSFQAVMGPLPAGAQRFNLMTVEPKVADAQTPPAEPRTRAAGDARNDAHSGSDPDAAGIAEADARPAPAAGRPETPGTPAQLPAAPPAAPSR